MLERNIESRVVERCRADGIITFKLSNTGERGAPDRVFIAKGRSVYVEFKRPGGKLSNIQVVMHNRLNAVGVKVYVCDDVEDGYLYVLNHLEYRPNTRI